VRWPPAWEFVSWSNELVVGQSPADKNLSTEAEDIVGIRHKATTGEHTADGKVLVLAVINCRMDEIGIALYV
jgi:hypothetical protein